MTREKLLRYLVAVAILLFWQCIGYVIPLPFSPIVSVSATSSQISVVGTLVAFFSAFIADIFLKRYQLAHPREKQNTQKCKRSK